MGKSFSISDVIPAPPEEIYRTWLDSAGHSGMTGSPAKASAEVGGAFEAWDGYIFGKNLELEPSRRILQAWRTSEFASTDQDSRLEVLFELADGGARVTIHHSALPDDGEQYKQGWIDFYFSPMKAYFHP